MAEVLSGGLLIPAAVLAILGWLVPVLFAKVLPEGVKPLMLIAFLSTVSLFAVSTVFFFVLYVGRGASASELSQFGLLENIVFFGRLGLSAGLIWAPIMLLSLANLPRRWVKETW